MYIDKSKKQQNLKWWLFVYCIEIYIKLYSKLCNLGLIFKMKISYFFFHLFLTRWEIDGLPEYFNSSIVWTRVIFLVSGIKQRKIDENIIRDPNIAGGRPLKFVTVFK